MQAYIAPVMSHIRLQFRLAVSFISLALPLSERHGPNVVRIRFLLFLIYDIKEIDEFS